MKLGALFDHGQKKGKGGQLYDCGTSSGGRSSVDGHEPGNAEG
jgi:hypothetical protein